MKRVLIVDDEPVVRRYLTGLLTRWGYDVIAVGSAVEALDVMASVPADIVLCDVTMPEHDGLWLAEQIQARWPHAAVIMSTAHDDSATVQQSRKLGAVAYVIKPIDPIMLREALNVCASRIADRLLEGQSRSARIQ
jgi:two-component system response regulator (stage 0 sporulation protein F)